MLRVLFLSLYYSLLSINHLSVKIEYLVTKDERELWCRHSSLVLNYVMRQTDLQ